MFSMFFLEHIRAFSLVATFLGLSISFAKHRKLWTFWNTEQLACLTIAFDQATPATLSTSPLALLITEHSIRRQRHNRYITRTSHTTTKHRLRPPWPTSLA